MYMYIHTYMYTVYISIRAYQISKMLILYSISFIYRSLYIVPYTEMIIVSLKVVLFFIES